MSRRHEYTIREVATLSGLPESTLRYYESIGLLDPVLRDENSKHRRYTDDDLDRVMGIACLSATGLSLDEMRRYLQNGKQGDLAARDQMALLERHRERLEEEARNLELRQRYVTVKIAFWRAVLAGDMQEQAKTRHEAQILAEQLRSLKASARNDPKVPSDLKES